MDIGISPDIHSSTDEYSKRFSGIAGEYLLSVQNKYILNCLLDSGSILDVGGGHLQISKIIDQNKYNYNLHGSDPICFQRANPNINKIIHPILKLSEINQKFDMVISIRQISHISDWKLFIHEITNVSSNLVIIDAPLSRGFNYFSDLLFSFKKNFEKNTRRYINFDEKELVLEFEKNGYKLEKKYYQFFFPMVIHRAIKNQKISSLIESLASFFRLTDFFGSPAIYSFKRN